MSKQTSAGDFELRFSEMLSRRILAGEQFSIELVRECYGQAGNELKLPTSAADDLYIADVFDALSKRQGEFAQLSQARLSKVIFDVIYMH